MQLLVAFDGDTLRRYAERESPLLFQIAFESDGVFFPNRQWSDFGCVVLGWWTTALSRLYQGSSREELSFMDGPYALTAFRGRSGLTLCSSEGPPFEARTSLGELRRQVAMSTNAALRTAASHGLGGADVDALQAGLGTLRRLRLGEDSRQ